MNVIEVKKLRKAYGSTVAVDNISFNVQKGEIFCIVGPNGAGKSTTVESIMGLRQPDGGSIRVLGLDPQKREHELRQRIGIQLQQAALPERLKVWEALNLYSSFYDKIVSWEKLLADWGLTEKRTTNFKNLSGGQKQRLFIALALLNDPELVFLDELTTGLDPQARHATWDAVRAIRDQGKTVVLLTHFMDEAEELADRIAIIDQGNVVALDTPGKLIQNLQAETRVRFTNYNGYDPQQLHTVSGVTDVEQRGKQVIVQGNGALLAHVATALAQHNVTPTDLRVEQADLEDVFLALTGRSIRN
ncbi:ABC transporter ATP-binding protein [Candidatus Leptofilum sp.]|uniref:ABC transporter ATP-binding protein n=1 Tax=Candidatus Leptofilum sp. TaxID=3241576 RepID=UPI003B5CC689